MLNIDVEYYLSMNGKACAVIKLRIPMVCNYTYVSLEKYTLNGDYLTDSWGEWDHKTEQRLSEYHLTADTWEEIKEQKDKAIERFKDEFNAYIKAYRKIRSSIPADEHYSYSCMP